MMGHLFRLVWNRRRANGLVLAELLVSFVVVAAVASTVVHLLALSRKPLGFDYENVWSIQIGGMSFRDAPEEEQAEIRNTLRSLFREVEAVDAVEVAGYTHNTPFTNTRSVTSQWWEGELIRYLYAGGTEDIAEVLGLQVTAGRWFDRGDLPTRTRIPVVMTRDALKIYFGNEDPVGRDLPEQEEDGTPRLGSEENPLYHVIGVVDDFRWEGEYGPLHHTLFRLIDLSGDDWFPPSEMLVRMRPGSAAAEEEALLRTLRRAAPGWNFQISSLSHLRAVKHRHQLAGPAIGFVVAGFLVITVALGLVGVLWQNVARRTQELAVRRAMGATAAGVRAQVLGEMIALATVAIVLGAVIVLQAPLLGVFPQVSWAEYLLAAAASATLVYGLVVLCGLYPSWLATRVDLARALQYE